MSTHRRKTPDYYLSSVTKINSHGLKTYITDFPELKLVEETGETF
jgi:hypothetical protein